MSYIILALFIPPGLPVDNLKTFIEHVINVEGRKYALRMNTDGTLRSFTSRITCQSVLLKI